MSHSIPFVIRPYAEADFADVLHAMQAAEAADDLPERINASDLHTYLADPARSPEDHFVAAAPGAGVVAFASARQGEGSEDYFYLTDGMVHPAWRRRGIGRALLQQQWQRVQAISAARGRPVVLGCRALTTQAAALALLEWFGMTRVRYFFEMRRSLTEPVPALTLPAHLTLRSWRMQEAEEAIWRALNEAFADHWNHVEMSFSEFQHRLASGRINPGASFVVWDGNDVAAVSYTHLRAHETVLDLVCRLLLEKKKT